MPDADELYGLPFDEFIPARNALVRELRGAGRREEAGEVAALRKPSVAAWAVNQLVRTQRKGVDELFEAGDGLRSVHDQVLAGRGDAGSLRGAVARERSAVDALTQAARGLLSSEGHELSATIIERVSDTLHAAALEDDARAQVREGRLERELRHVGLGMTPGAAPVRTRARTREKPVAEPKKDRKADREARRRLEREARRRLERATRAVSTARERRDKAAAAVGEAEEALTEAQREKADAERAIRELG